MGVEVEAPCSLGGWAGRRIVGISRGPVDRVAGLLVVGVELGNCRVEGRSLGILVAVVVVRMSAVHKVVDHGRKTEGVGQEGEVGPHRGKVRDVERARVEQRRSAQSGCSYPLVLLEALVEVSFGVVPSARAMIARGDLKVGMDFGV